MKGVRKTDGLPDFRDGEGTACKKPGCLFQSQAVAERKRGFSHDFLEDVMKPGRREMQ